MCVDLRASQFAWLDVKVEVTAQSAGKRAEVACVPIACSEVQAAHSDASKSRLPARKRFWHVTYIVGILGIWFFFSRVSYINLLI